MSVRSGELSEKGDRPPIDAQAARRLVESLALHESHEIVATEGESLPSGYIIDRSIGGGGGGRVFRAFREGSDRPLALKVLDRRLGDGPQAMRAWRELRILQDLRLRCLPALIDYAEHRGRLCIATEYVEGLALDEHCEAKQLTRRERVELLARVCDAVQSLHEHGVIHRDLKPSNVLIDGTGEPVIIDLGIATLLSGDGSQTLTEEGRPIGTPAFMAPEQARGERQLISTRSDVYALGATAYKVLTGSTPHDTATTIHEAVRRVAQDPPRDARSLDWSLPKALAAVLGKACSARPEGRYASAAELGEDLRRWLRGEGVTATGAGVWRRVWWWSRRHKVATGLLAAIFFVGCVLATSLCSVWWLNQRPHKARYDSNGGTSGVGRLLSYSNNVLYEWGDSDGRSVARVWFSKRPESLGGGAVAIVAFGPTDPDPGLTVFDANNPTRVMWSVSAKGQSLVPPPPESDRTQDGFEFATGGLFDVFPEEEGLELLAIWNSVSGNASAIRIHDLAGRTLFEAWHFGFVLSTHWLTEPSLLIVMGENSEYSWRCRGQQTAPYVWPMIVAAIPVAEAGVHGWIRTPDRAGDISPAWYRCIMPRAGAQDYLYLVGPCRTPQFDSTSYFRLNVGDTQSIVSADGIIVDQIKFSQEQQTPLTQSGLPMAPDVRLEELPAAVAGCE